MVTDFATALDVAVVARRFAAETFEPATVAFAAGAFAVTFVGVILASGALTAVGLAVGTTREAPLNVAAAAAAAML